MIPCGICKQHIEYQKAFSGCYSDADKIAKKLSVKKDTVYVVRSELKHMSEKPSGKLEASRKGLLGGLPSKVTDKVTGKPSEGSKGALRL